MDMQEVGLKLGDYIPKFARFANVQETLERCKKQLQGISCKEKIEKLNQLLLTQIQQVPAPCFLLPAVSEFIEIAHHLQLVDGYTFFQFELWLNCFSPLTESENYAVRAKIAGRHIPREEYQTLFPIGMNKTYAGSHYVTAHSSPDLDTTVASFWGWVDAFSAKVSSGLHVWNVPGGAPTSQVEIDFLFYQIFGKSFFSHFAKTRTALALSAVDLVESGHVVCNNPEDKQCSVQEEAMILVDELGYYIGDWKEGDKEEVREVVLLLQHIMRWFSNHFQRAFLRLLSDESVTKEKIEKGIEELFAQKLAEADPVKEFAQKQKTRFTDYLTKVFSLSKGMDSSFEDLWQQMQRCSVEAFSSFFAKVQEMITSLFNAQGEITQNRAIILRSVEQMAISLETAICGLRSYTDQWDVAHAIKREVLHIASQTASYRAEVEELREKIGEMPYMAVTMRHEGEGEYPIGVIRAQTLRKPVLGTVSLRDFCNREETKIPSYFDVISVVDHHKSVLQTTSPVLAMIADAQSANALVAELSFAIHDKYSSVGFLQEKDLLDMVAHIEKTPRAYRILQRVLCKTSLAHRDVLYYVDPAREYIEYLQYLYAILDDTDLLSKVSHRDVVSVASLLNRLKTISLQKETEIIDFDDLPQDGSFVKKAAQRILQNADMYSLYKKIYALKEERVEESLLACARREPSTLFADTKVQNGCCRVGQSKLFVKNFSCYFSHRAQICHFWQREAQQYFAENSECDLHIHMMSTVPSADDVHLGENREYAHKDELWIWIPEEEQAIGHLKEFLWSFSHSSTILSSSMEVEFVGKGAIWLEQIFLESFASFSLSSKDIVWGESPASIAVIRYRAGLLNSRKAMISPYLPKVT